VFFVIQIVITELKEAGIEIFDCDVGKAIEQQVFQDLPWDGIERLINYVANFLIILNIQIHLK